MNKTLLISSLLIGTSALAQYSPILSSLKGNELVQVIPVASGGDYSSQPVWAPSSLFGAGGGGGGNNPVFTGIVTMPDGSTWTTGGLTGQGLNNWKGMNTFARIQFSGSTAPNTIQDINDAKGQPYTQGASTPHPGAMAEFTSGTTSVPSPYCQGSLPLCGPLLSISEEKSLTSFGGANQCSSGIENNCVALVTFALEGLPTDLSSDTTLNLRVTDKTNNANCGTCDGNLLKGSIISNPSGTNTAVKVGGGQFDVTDGSSPSAAAPGGVTGFAWKLYENSQDCPRNNGSAFGKCPGLFVASNGTFKITDFLEMDAQTAGAWDGIVGMVGCCVDTTYIDYSSSAISIDILGIHATASLNVFAGAGPVLLNANNLDLGGGSLLNAGNLGTAAFYGLGDGVFNNGALINSAGGKVKTITAAATLVLAGTDCGAVVQGDGTHTPAVTLPTTLLKTGCQFTFEPVIFPMDISTNGNIIKIPGDGDHNITQLHVPIPNVKLSYFSLVWTGTLWQSADHSLAFYETFEPLDDQVLYHGQVRFDYDGSQYFTLIPQGGPGGLIVNGQMNRISPSGMKFDKAGTTSSNLNYFYVTDFVSTGVTGTSNDGGKVQIALGSAISGVSVGDQITFNCWSILGTVEANGWGTGVITIDTSHFDISGSTFTNTFTTSPDANCRIINLLASTTGHVTTNGIEVKSGTPGQTLVGMAYIAGSNAANDSATKRDVASWFNQKNKTCINKFTTDRTTTSSTYAELNAEIECEFVTWGVSDLPWSIVGTGKNGTIGDGWAVSAGFDSTSTSETEESANINGGTASTPVAVPGSKSGLSEGKHFITLLGHVIAGGTETVFGTTPDTSLEVRIPQ